VNILSDALFELRVHMLIRIARIKNIEADEGLVRQLARSRSDTLVMRELQANRTPLRWGFGWFRR
jgi:hypothetical protein